MGCSPSVKPTRCGIPPTLRQPDGSPPSTRADARLRGLRGERGGHGVHRAAGDDRAERGGVVPVR